MVSVTEIWRHPIKSHGRESLEAVALTAGKTMPWDRVWAVAHELSKADGTQWEPCVNFSNGAKAPALMAINARVDEAAGTITLRHPTRPDLTIDPDSEGAALIEWVRPLMPVDRAASARVLRVPGRGMTDTDYPSVSLGNIASHAELEDAMGQPLSKQRWRCNFWLEGVAPWDEFNWIGKSLRIGEAEVTVRERVKRCLATTTNPETGIRDADTLNTLNADYGHQDFCVYAEVTKSGRVASGDRAEVI